MHTKLIYLTCLVLVLGPALTSTASAEIANWWKFDEGSGTYTLEFAYREDGLLLDAIVISKLD